MLRRVTSVLTLVAVTALATAAVTATPRAHSSPDRTTVHEWGTFTTIAGADGRAVDWLPLGGPTDLPCFVEHFQNRRDVKVLPGSSTNPLNYEAARSSLLGKVRMETPVLYFYAPRETHVDVRVQFPRGLMTEWYPHATVTQSLIGATTLRDPKHVSIIEWQNVTAAPAAPRPFPTGEGESHYYAARATEASPLAVNGQSEKFLFYRGIADFDVPISTVALENGAVRIGNLDSDDIPAVMLFENRGGALGYRVQTALHGETTLEPPVLNTTLANLRVELEHMLVNAGLYPKEAAAMVATWGDSWFESGTRVFYIVPRRAVESVLPLQVTPAPASVTRVFVGRMEVVTPAVERAVERAIDGHDAAAIERYGRFLGPITDRILAKSSNADRNARIRGLTDAAFASYLKRASACE